MYSLELGKLLAFTLLSAGMPDCNDGRSVRLAAQPVAASGKTVLVAQKQDAPVRLPAALLIGAVAPMASRRRLRILIYARYSNEAQNPRSINDQVALCRRFIETLGLSDFEVLVESDAAETGEHVRRTGIDRVWEAIESRDCDIIIMEEMARLYRHLTQSLQLIESAVDQGIRVIAINNQVDTAEDESRWRLGSVFASLKAEMDNAETRKRINRALEARWREGYAVSALRPGYRRIPTSPATEGKPARGPHRDEKDERWTSVIVHAYEICANGDPAWKVAEYLTEAGFPKGPRAKLEEWTEDEVLRFLRNPIYRGEELFRVRHNERKFKTGRSVQVLTAPDKILRRDMPHLAHVPAWLWYKANRSLDERPACKAHKGGSDHPLHGVPRDSRGALSLLFICGICGATMYRDEFGFRCANSKRRPNLKRQGDKPCWNRCYPRTETVYRKIGGAIVDAITSRQGCFDALCKKVKKLVEEGSPKDRQRIEALRRRDAELGRSSQNLVEAIERHGDLDDLAHRLRERQEERRRLACEIEQLSDRTGKVAPPPTARDIHETVDALKAHLLGEMGREVGPLLRRIVNGQIRAIPYKLIDRDGVFLRAHLELNLLQLLPGEWPEFLSDKIDSGKAEELTKIHTVSLIVDLFERPKRVRYAREVHELVRDGATISEAAHRLGLPENTANRARRLGALLAERGLDDPYVELKAMPKRPGRWKPQSNRPDVFDADPH